MIECCESNALIKAIAVTHNNRRSVVCVNKKPTSNLTGRETDLLSTRCKWSVSTSNSCVSILQKYTQQQDKLNIKHATVKQTSARCGVFKFVFVLPLVDDRERCRMMTVSTIPYTGIAERQGNASRDSLLMTWFVK